MLDKNTKNNNNNNNNKTKQKNGSKNDSKEHENLEKNRPFFEKRKGKIFWLIFTNFMQKIVDFDLKRLILQDFGKIKENKSAKTEHLSRSRQ